MIYTSTWAVDLINLYLGYVQEFGRTLDIQALLVHMQEYLTLLSPLLNVVMAVSDYFGSFVGGGTFESEQLKAGISEFGVIQSTGWVDFIKSFVAFK